MRAQPLDADSPMKPTRIGGIDAFIYGRKLRGSEKKNGKCLSKRARFANVVEPNVDHFDTLLVADIKIGNERTVQGLIGLKDAFSLK